MLQKLSIAILSLCAVFFASARAEDTPRNSCFTITVVDEQTGRGVPLVELRTVSELRFYTDSNGIVAFNEPGLMDRDVFFFVRSHGYTYAPDGFGFQGKTLKVTSGGSAQLKIKRTNIAERLYRITGEGIYRDSILAGKPVPIRQPVLNAQVTGQDTVQLAEYHGKYYWFYGDTNKPGYPLGHFGTSGATSEKPETGGLSPDKGIDLKYFTDSNGFARPTCAWNEPGPKWVEGIFVVRDEQGAEHLLGQCAHMKNLGEVLDRSLILFDDKEEVFKQVAKFKPDEDLLPPGHAFPYKVKDQEYIYFATPFATVRVKADYRSAGDLQNYEAFTCLQPGSHYSKSNPQFERDGDGHLIWGWKLRTSPITFARQKELIGAGKMKADEARYKILDVESGKAITPANGCIHYNNFRKRWIMIINESFGTSMLGEIWYSEAENPEGPWERARKIVTHDNYTFYNVSHHPQFDQENGKFIYFEGTYTITFSGNKLPTPLYEYNQIMYRLDLSDPRLNLDTVRK